MNTVTTLAASSSPSPKRNSKDCPKKSKGGGTTPPIPLADLYEHAYQEVWAGLASWKRLVITNESDEGVDRLRQEFINQVEQEVNRLTNLS